MLSPRMVTGLAYAVEMVTLPSGPFDPDNMLVRKANGTVWGWGYNMYRELGTGNTALAITPIQIPSINLN